MSPPPLPPPSAHYKRVGFEYDPFSLPRAETVPTKLWDDLFVESQNIGQIEDYVASTLFWGRSGSGKTTFRLYLERRLDRVLTAALKERERARRGNLLAPVPLIYAPLTVIYTHWPTTPTALTQGILEACATAVLRFINNYPNEFLAAPSKERCWWWEFLSFFLPTVPIAESLGTVDLQTDFGQSPSSTDAVKTMAAKFAFALQQLLTHLAGLGLTDVFILVDDLEHQNLALRTQNTLIHHLVDDLALWQLPHLYWKIFLPTTLAHGIKSWPICQKAHAKPVPLLWNSQNIEDMLNRRLSWASGEQITTIDTLISQSLIHNFKEEFITIVLDHAHLGEPRALLEASAQLWSLCARHNVDRITPAVAADFMQSYAPQALKRFDVFMSFAGEDRELAQQLLQEIKNQKMRVFYDKDDSIKPRLWGRDIRGVLNTVIKQSSVFLVLGSWVYWSKPWTNIELEMAQKIDTTRQNFVLVFRLDASPLPGWLQERSYLSWDDGDLKSIIRTLRKILRERQEG